MNYYDQLVQNYTEIGPLCAGLDPHPHLLAAWDLPVSPIGLDEFVARCIEAFLPTVGMVKPQVALFEAFGSVGFRILEAAIKALREAGIIVIADAKRGDIGSTMEGYGQAWFDDKFSSLASNALTVSPYLGPESLNVIADIAQKHQAGLFVLAKTSNAQAQQMQDAMINSHTTVAQSIVDWANNVNSTQSQPSVGLVIGATREHNLNLDEYFGPILIPGLGTQGGASEDLKLIFKDCRGKNILIPNMSRMILSAGPSAAVLSSTIMGYNRELRGILGQ